VHRLVAETVLVKRKLNRNEVVHHIDGNKFNNDPKNLEIMFDSEHKALEIRKTMQTDLWQKSNSKRVIEFNKTDLMRKASARNAKIRNNTPKQKACCSYGASKFLTKSEDLKTQYLSYVNDNCFIPYKDFINNKIPINHKVIEVIKLNYTEDVFDITVDEHHNFLLEEGVYVHNCAGWSLKSLLREGFNGVKSHIEAEPPKNLSSAIGQMVNFLGTLQNEWAGAQAFSSVDTLLSPYIRLEKEKLIKFAKEFKTELEESDLKVINKQLYNIVKQNVQVLIFNLNVPSRWGCVDTNTEVLSVDGWKNHEQLKEGDLVYTWKDGGINIQPVNKIVKKHFKGNLHKYFTKNYSQTVTPEHRILYNKTTKVRDKDIFDIAKSEELFEKKELFSFPTTFNNIAERPDIKNLLKEEELFVIMSILTSGKILYEEDGSVFKYK
jgi:hypothetical protein